MAKRKDTKLESEGAEFLVLGHLLIEGIHCYKAYVNFPGYDLQAVNPKTGKTVKIQVKSRWATDYDKSFSIKNFDCDFVIHVALNRGDSFSKAVKKGDSKTSPIFYVWPVKEVRKAREKQNSFNKVKIKKIRSVEKPENNWQLIRDFLEKK